MRKVLLVGLVFTLACQKKEETQNSAPSAIESATAGSLSDAPTTYTTAVPSAPASGVKLNPPHGEPGHLCEIEVGAPLPVDVELPEPVEVTPARPTPVALPTTSVLNRPINTAVPSGPKPQFNPPHGQPWHTCDLEVGAPLK